MNKTVDERFWEKVDVAGPDDCWLWTAAQQYGGYGRFWDGLRVVGAHQYSYVAEYSLIPFGLHVLHSCDNPPCVNPRHLFLGTQADNVQDMRRKGRGYDIGSIPGERNHNAKLTEAQALRIKRWDFPEGTRLVDVGEQFGVSHVLVSQIRRGISWKHLNQLVEVVA